jgi:hypothetical protein
MPSPLVLQRNSAAAVAILGVWAQLGLAGPAFATPVPASAAGSLSPGQTITISGSAFGSTGPQVVMMEDFERDSPGQKIQLSGAPAGAWTAFGSSNTFLASANAHTGKVGFHAYDQTDKSGNILYLVLNGSYQEAFISMWVEIPAGATFPGASSSSGGPPGPDQFSSDSSWKFAWLLQNAKSYGTTSEFDLVNFTYGGSNQFIPAESNSNYYMYIEPGNYSQNANNIGTAWWSWNGWNRVVTWLRGNSTVPAGAPGGMVQTLNAAHGMSTWQIGNPTTYPTSAMFQNGVPQYFTQINVPGWFRENSGPNADPTYDDIYIAVGPGAAARVEVTDAPVYTQSHHATILHVVSWSDGQITASVPNGGLDFTGPAYLYVTDASGDTSATGLPINGVLPDPPADIQVK